MEFIFPGLSIFWWHLQWLWPWPFDLNDPPHRGHGVSLLIYIKLTVKQILPIYINHSPYLSPDGSYLRKSMREKANTAILLQSKRVYSYHFYYVFSTVRPGIQPATFLTWSGCSFTELLRQSLWVWTELTLVLTKLPTDCFAWASLLYSTIQFALFYRTY